MKMKSIYKYNFIRDGKISFEGNELFINGYE